MQQQINERQAEVISQMARTQSEFVEIAALNCEVMNHLVVEMTRLSIEMKNHKMLVESVAGRLDFEARRARSPEKPAREKAPVKRSRTESEDAEANPEKRRRRRRRGRRRSSSAPPDGGEAPQGTTEAPAEGGVQAADPGPRSEEAAALEPAAPVGPVEAPGAPADSEPTPSSPPSTGGGSSGQ